MRFLFRMEMIVLKKYLSIFITVTMLIGLFSFNAVALDSESMVQETTEKVKIMMEENQNVFILRGEHGAVLLVKSISDNEYSELIDILYPNGLIDSQGLDIPGINNIESVRRDFIINNTEVFSVVGENKIKVPFTTFEVNIQSKSNGEYSIELCKANIGNDVFVFPLEWDNQPYNFICNSKENLFVVYTDLGIWRIDISDNSAVKISSDPQVDANRVTPDEGYIVWIDNAMLSPSGSYIVYRSNRDSKNLDYTSIWKINLETGNETKIINAAENNDIVGFIDENNIVTGSINETKIVNIINGNTININVPDVPNMVVKAVNKGKFVYTGYPDGSSISTAYIGELNTITGKIKPITTITGYLDADVSFTPSGNKIAIGYGEEPANGINDIVVVDFTNNTGKRTENSAEKFNIINTEKKKVINKYLWFDEDAIFVNGVTNNNNAKVIDRSSSRASKMVYRILAITEYAFIT